MGRQVSAHRRFVARQLGRARYVFQVPDRDPQAYLYDEHDRRGQDHTPVFFYRQLFGKYLVIFQGIN